MSVPQCLFSSIGDMPVMSVYTKRVSVTSEGSQRLPGTAPYNLDPALSVHHWHAHSQTGNAFQAMNKLFTIQAGQVSIKKHARNLREKNRKSWFDDDNAAIGSVRHFACKRLEKEMP